MSGDLSTADATARILQNAPFILASPGSGRGAGVKVVKVRLADELAGARSVALARGDVDYVDLVRQIGGHSVGLAQVVMER